MPKCKVVLLTEARLQLKDIAMFYKAKVGTASAKIITDKIMKELRRLEDFPELGVVPKSPAPRQYTDVVPALPGPSSVPGRAPTSL